jgi:sulfatase modifying factor 1
MQILPVFALVAALSAGALAQAAEPAMQRIEGADRKRFDIDRTEVSIGEFRRFVQATGTVTQAERAGGGSTFEAGWERRAGWVWHAPFGKPGADKEPVAHVTYPEAEAFCRWVGKRLPTDTEWGQAAYTEQRAQPSAGFTKGKTYAFPTGDSPQGANCLGDCGNTAVMPAVISSCRA